MNPNVLSIFDLKKRRGKIYSGVQEEKVQEKKKMPEGPEVTMIARQLQSILHGKYLRHVRIVSGPYHDSNLTPYEVTRSRIAKLNTLLRSARVAMRIDNVYNKGKYIVFNMTKLTRQTQSRTQSVSTKLDKKPLCIGSSLGLNGHWILESPDSETQKHDYVRMEFEFADHPKQGASHKLLYTDKLSMGKISIESPEWIAAKLSQIGPDALSLESEEIFAKAFAGSDEPVYMSLVNQTRISGVGNIYRSEIIEHARKLHQFDPFAPVRSLNATQMQALYTATRAVLQEALQKGGVADYHDIHDKPGKYVPIVYHNKKVSHIVDPDKRKFFYTAA